MNVGQDIMELYQQVILDHNKNPRNFKKLEGAQVIQEGFNPLCGDHLHLYLNYDSQGKVEEITFHGEGCAISKASASMMTTFIKGKTKEEAQELFQEFHQLLIGKLDPAKDKNKLGKLQVFSGIWRYPARVKCAGLSWHTLKAALEGKTETVKTE